MAANTTEKRALDAYSEAVSRAAETVGPAVVKIEVLGRGGRGPSRAQRGEGTGTGSGVIFASDGRVLTNEHVVRGSSLVRVTLADGRRFQAGVEYADPSVDLAVLRIGAVSLPVAELNAGPLRVGQLVIAIGNPYGLNWSVTAGVVSALGRTLEAGPSFRLTDLIQMDTPVNPGNSGGPLVDATGRVVGITSAVMPFARGVGFAIPIATALDALTRLEEMREHQQHRLGIGGIPAEIDTDVRRRASLTQQRGLLVLEVVPNSPAARASLRVSDVIVEVEGRPVTTGEALAAAANQASDGRLRLSFLRDGRLRQTTAAL
jgi:S1-C subfamily serine protease